MSRRSKTALFGFGHWGKKIYGSLKANPDFELRHVHFPSLKGRSPEAICAELGPEFTASPDEIWRDPDIDSVVVATPIHTHFAVAKAALQHRKHVLVEKPLALTASECSELGELAAAAGRKLMTEYTYTFSPGLAHARELVAAGRIGRVETIQIALKQLGRFLPYDILYLLGSHALSILDLFVPLGSLTFVAQPLQRTGDLMTGCMVCFDSAGDRLSGCFEVTVHSPLREHRVTIGGERGTVIYAPDEKDTVTLVEYERSPRLRGEELVRARASRAFDEGHNLDLALRAFYRLVSGDEPDNFPRSLAISRVLDRLGAKWAP